MIGTPNSLTDLEKTIREQDMLLALKCLELAVATLARVLGIEETGKLLQESMRQLDEY